MEMTNGTTKTFNPLKIRLVKLPMYKGVGLLYKLLIIVQSSTFPLNSFIINNHS